MIQNLEKAPAPHGNGKAIGNSTPYISEICPRHSVPCPVIVAEFPSQEGKGEGVTRGICLGFEGRSGKASWVELGWRVGVH
jgi:hypothetical protein